MAWNWEWVSAIETTNRLSQSIDQSAGVVYTYRPAARGPISSPELRASFDSVSVNIGQHWRIWNSYVQPILDSLPAGRRDQRWNPGKGLPTKIDALSYGIQGTTLFVFNDSSLTKASRRYWHTIDERPITIAEAIENIWTAIDNLDIDTTTVESGGDVDLSALWFAIGNRYEGFGAASDPSSLDARLTITEGYLTQLENDIYGSIGGYGYGTSLVYSIAQNIEALLQIHNVSSWQDNPDNVSHGDFAAEEHTHPYTDILRPSIDSYTVARTTNNTLQTDIGRLRYEIANVKGVSWYEDIDNPAAIGGMVSLQTHVNYVGTGTASTINPHGIAVADIGADVYFENIANYIGMDDYTDTEMPDYTSTTYVTQNTDLTTAISELDQAITSALSGFVYRREINSADRSYMSETEREITPIVWEHNEGTYPVIQIIDLYAVESDSGIYYSPTIDAIIDYPDANTVQILTSAAYIKIIGLFGGAGVGAPSTVSDFVRSISVADSGLAALQEDITLIAGSNITITQLNQTITIEATGSGGAHASQHITDGADEINGDLLDIDWNPSNYSPALVGGYATSIDNLTAHLYGIDTVLGNLAAHASEHEYDGSDPIDGDDLEVSYSPSNYTDYSQTLAGHLLGIDVALGSIEAGEGLWTLSSTTIVPLDSTQDVAITISGETNKDVLTLTLSGDHLSTYQRDGLVINKQTYVVAADVWNDNHHVLLQGQSPNIWSDTFMYVGIGRETSTKSLLYLVDQKSELSCLSTNTSYSAYISAEATDSSAVIKLSTNGTIEFTDGFLNWTSPTFWLSESADEWTALKTLNSNNEKSLVASILAAAQSQGTHASFHEAGGSDEINGDNLEVSYSPSNYSAYDATLGWHLAGIDDALSSHTHSNADASNAGFLIALGSDNDNQVLTINASDTQTWAFIADINIDASAAIAVTKLALGGANEVLQSSGAANSWGVFTDALHGSLSGGTLHSAVSNSANGFCPSVGASGTILSSTGTAGSWITGNNLAITYAASNYSPYTATLEGHLIGIDDALSGIGGGGESLDATYDIGSSITADNGAVEITTPDESDNDVLVLTQNDSTNDPNVLKIVNNTDASDQYSDDGIYYPSSAGSLVGISIKLEGSTPNHAIVTDTGSDLIVGSCKLDTIEDYIFDSFSRYRSNYSNGGIVTADTLIGAGFYPSDSADPYTSAQILLRSRYVISDGSMYSYLELNTEGSSIIIGSFDNNEDITISAEDDLIATGNDFNLNFDTITLDTCVIAADGSEINNLLHIDYGSAPTTASYSRYYGGGILTVNFATGKPMQEVTTEDNVIEVNITSPDGINRYSLLIKGDSSIYPYHNVPLNTFAKTGGGGTFIWPQGITDNFDVGVVDGREIEVLVTMEYRGSDTWYCSYTVMDLGAVA